MSTTNNSVIVDDGLEDFFKNLNKCENSDESGDETTPPTAPIARLRTALNVAHVPRAAGGMVNAKAVTPVAQVQVPLETPMGASKLIICLNFMKMIFRICMAFMSEAWSRGYIIPVLCFIGTVMRCPFVSLMWSGVYLAASVVCLVLTWSQAARNAVLVFGGATWEKTKQAAVYAYESGFVWVLPLAFLVGTVACYYLTGWWSLTILCLIATFVCYMCCYSWEKVKKTHTYAFLAPLQDNVWATIKKTYEIFTDWTNWVKAELAIIFLALTTIGVLFLIFMVRIASESQIATQIVLFMMFGFVAPPAKKTGIFAYIAVCAISLAVFFFIPENQSSLTTPTLNNLRADNLMRLLWNSGLAIWTPFMRIDQITRCDGKWESDWCKQLIAVVKTENKIYREIGDKHVKNDDLFSRYHTVDFVLNATKNTTDNVSIGDVIGKNFHLFATTSYESNTPILGKNAVDYLLIDAYNRTEQAAHDTEGERDTNFCVDRLWTATSFVTNHAVKMMTFTGVTDFASKFVAGSYGLDFAFFSYTLLVNPGNLDGLDYDHSLARNVCTHMHLCVNGTPMVEEKTTDVKPLSCNVTCPSCNVTNAKNDTNETAEEPSQTILHGFLASQFTVIVEKETMEKTDVTADATDNTHIATKTVKLCAMLSIIFIVAGAMAAEMFRAGMNANRAWVDMVTVTPNPSRGPSRVGSRVGSRTGSRTVSPAGSRQVSPARNSGGASLRAITE